MFKKKLYLRIVAAIKPKWQLTKNEKDPRPIDNWVRISETIL